MKIYESSKTQFCYLFHDDAYSGTIEDSSPKANHGVITEAVDDELRQGIVGPCTKGAEWYQEFQGNYITPSSNVTIEKIFTFCCWFYHPGGGNPMLIAPYSTNGENYGLKLSDDGGATLPYYRLRIWISYLWSDIYYGYIDYTIGTWKHLAIVVNRDVATSSPISVKLYINGVLQTITVSTNSNINSDFPPYKYPLFVTGSQGYGKRNFKFAECLLINSELKEEDILRLYHCRISGEPFDIDCGQVGQAFSSFSASTNILSAPTEEADVCGTATEII